ncbi:hypothetical protein G7Y31_08360 [Corynebacterium lizhenjunii]|uniref:Uncharacterized protein n=1 Tax=Corynebacterium lizhenjunii TaxID=2709394 RepID=A0A7T0KE31_9CORY|nr:hypothetical protein [Corynebacterium lizhenjunii]QPK78565.1 hypothetical protein G7Y31_08360 [Corynebacterium lizhenjunii]
MTQTYAGRAVLAHALLLLLAGLFVFSSLLPVWAAGAIAVAVVALMLLDGLRRIFAPEQAATRTLRLVSLGAGAVHAVGWGMCLVIFGSYSAVSSTAYSSAFIALYAGMLLNILGLYVALSGSRASRAGLHNTDREPQRTTVRTPQRRPRRSQGPDTPGHPR